MLLSRPFQNTSNDEFSVAVKLLLLCSDIGQFKDSRILTDQYLRSRQRYTREFEISKSRFHFKNAQKSFPFKLRRRNLKMQQSPAAVKLDCTLEG